MTNTTASAFFDKHEKNNRYNITLYGLISSFIHEIKSARTEKSRDARINRINTAMILFPKDAPEGFNEWFTGKFYDADIFDKNKRIRSFKDKRRVVICHRACDKTLFEWATVELTATRDNREPMIWVTVNHRIVRYSKGDKHFDYKNIMYWGYAWREYKYGFDDWAFVYPSNLTEVFGERYHNVDLKKEMSDLIQPVKFMSLLCNLEQYPQAEYFVKMGLTRLVSDLDEFDFVKGNDFESILGVNKQYLPLYRNLQFNADEHTIVKNSKPTVTAEQFQKLKALKFKERDILPICNLLKTMSFERFVNYFTKQKQIVKGSLNRLMIFYNDYIKMSTDLEIDLSRKSVRFPKNIKESHDRVMMMFKEVENKIEDEKFKRAMRNLYKNLTSYNNNGFVIVLPQSKTDFVREGQALSHCVGSMSGYYEDHKKGAVMIFFVREKSDIDKPFATLQIDMKRLAIIQLMGYGNKSVTAEVRKFANQFLKELSKKENDNENKPKQIRKKAQSA